MRSSALLLPLLAAVPLLCGSLPAAAQDTEPRDNTPLAYRILEGEGENSLLQLLERGLEPNLAGPEGTTLLMAASTRRWTLAEELLPLLAAGADPNRRDRDGETALIYAARTFNPGAAEALLAFGAKVDARDRRGSTALHHCVNWHQYDLIIGGRREQCAEVARRLISAGASLTARDRFGMTPLMWAANAEHAPALEVLLKAGADPSFADRKGRTALTWRAWAGPEDEIVRTLLAAGARVSLVDALLLNDPIRARMLLDEGASVHGVGGDNQTPLMLAARLGDLDLVRRLLRRGADVRARDRRGNTALMYAAGGREVTDQLGQSRWVSEGADRGRQFIVEALLKAGVPPDAVNKQGQDALTWMVGLRQTEALEALIRGGARCRAASGRYYLRSSCALEVLSARGDLRLVKLILKHRNDPHLDAALPAALASESDTEATIAALIDAGADPNGRGRERGWPLAAAASSGRLERVEELLRRGAKLGARSGARLMVEAVRSGSVEIVRRFLTAGVPPDAAEHDRTPLMLAARWGREELVRMLLQAGADPTRNDKRGRTAVTDATEAGHPAIAALLQEAIRRR